MRFDVVTLFPEIFRGYLGQSLLAKAIDAQRVAVKLHDLRNWAKGPNRQVDDRPFGGGPGMVFKPDVVVECVEEIENDSAAPSRVIMLTPTGRRLDQAVVEELSEAKRLILLCGRYEGFDQRISDILRPDEISVGDFVLNGGEVAAMILIDAVIRLVPGVLGDETSAELDSFSGSERRLEYAQYTRPREFRGYHVPDVLLNGDHAAIAKWRDENSRQRTADQNARE